MSQLKYVPRVIAGSQGSKVVKLPRPVDAIYVLLPLCAIFLWVISLKHVDVQRMSDLGLVSALPPRIITSFIILTISFCLTLRQPRIREPLLMFHVVLLILMVFGVENLIEEAPRFGIVYRHAGYTEYIMRTGSVDLNLDAYFSWPGFFVLSALVTKVAGYDTILSYAGWAPVFYNLIYFGPMYMIFSSATTNKRLLWLALWFFYLTNWIGQDYFSPQGLNFFLYLVIIAILLKWFKVPSRGQPHRRWRSRRGSNPFQAPARTLFAWLTAPDQLYTPGHPWQRRVLLAYLVLIFALVVFSHPLTPFFLLVSVTALVVFHRCNPRWLPILMAVMTGAWILFMTQTFLAGHSNMVTGDIGQVGGSIATNVTERVTQGNPEHTFIAEMRVIMTGFIWLLAAVGTICRLCKGRYDITYILLAVAPFPLLAMHQYGGEMFLRIYLFALPLMAFFAAACFYHMHSLSIRGTSLRMTAAITGTCLVLLVGFLFTRYGNEHMDYMTYAEVNGIRYLYSIAKPDSLFISGWNDTPWQYQDYEKYTCYSMADVLPEAVITGDANAVIRFIKGQKRPYTYLLFTRGEKAQAYSLSGVPVGALDRLEAALLKSGKFKLIYKNPDVQVLIYQGGTS